MEDLLNSLIERWEVQTCTPRYMPDTHAHDLEGINYHFLDTYRPIFEYFFRLKPGNSQDESPTFPGHFMVHRLIAGGLNYSRSAIQWLKIWTGHEGKSVG